ncbi:MAG: putative toxin-antitoxin system toxin component, PIN family, partial [Candidatus Aminicenantes bacterium]|nr:putative toxin-antitoxin system toxin component, PIN family [Candidatus Aminicenantes bacterium]
MIRAVIDTNILVSGLIKPDGPPGRILKALRDGRFTIILSSTLLEEIAAVLLFPRVRDKYGIDRRARETLSDLLALRGDLVAPPERLRVCRDPDDDRILEAAVGGHADYVVTGDVDLLHLEGFRTTK